MLRRLFRYGAVTVLTIGLAYSHVVATALESADARAGLVGSWRIVSYELEFQDGSERRFPFGSHPNGYLIFGADGRMMAYLEANGRKAPQTDAERSAAYRALIAYTGKYHVHGDKWVTRVDGAWNVEWRGTDQERSFTLDGDRLSVIAQWNANALYAGKMTRGHLTFERDK